MSYWVTGYGSIDRKAMRFRLIPSGEQTEFFALQDGIVWFGSRILTVYNGSTSRSSLTSNHATPLPLQHPVNHYSQELDRWELGNWLVDLAFLQVCIISAVPGTYDLP